MASLNSVVGALYTPVMVLCGIVLNLLTIMVFCQHRMRKYCVSLSMICLAISDTNVLIFPVFFTWLDEYFFDFYFLNNTLWCQLHAYLDLVFCAHSSWIIILISTERWFAIYKPFKKARIFTNSRVAWTLLILFLLGTVVFIRIPLSMHLMPTNNRTSECGIKLKTTYTLFGSLSIILIYVIPSIILAILNIMIIVRMRIRPFSKSSIQMRRSTARARKRQRETLQSQSVAGEFCLSNSEIELAENQTRHSSSTINSKTDRNMSITLVTVAMVFMILTFPYQGYWFYEQWQQFRHPDSETEQMDSPPLFQKLTLTIKNMNYVINFFMYSALSTLFREEFIAIFTRKKSQTNQNTRHTINLANVNSIYEAPSDYKIKMPYKPPLAEFEFPLLPCLEVPTRLKVRIETSNLRKLIERRKQVKKRDELFIRRKKESRRLAKQPISSSNRTPKRIEFADPLRQSFV